MLIIRMFFNKSVLIECCKYENEAFSNSHEMQYGAIKHKKSQK